MPAKRQKVRHGTIALSEAFTVEDTAYVPSSSLRDRFGGKLRQETRVLKEKAPKRVPRPQKRNLRDPFHTLNDDEVQLIIVLLPARDTETLRRVSKLWKASSEYHCGKSALMRHFPWAVAKAEQCETREAGNLQFRRCLHFQQNLQLGLATRAFRHDGVSDWDIRENRLIWTSGDGEISISDLRTANDTSIIDVKIMKLDTSHILPAENRRPYFRILPGGDFLMTTLIIKDDLTPMHRLARISAQETVLWSLDLEASMTRPTIGKDSVYFIHVPWHRTNTDSGKTLSFAKHRLSDGSKVFDVTMKREMHEKHSNTLELDWSMVLTENECVAWWRMNSRGAVYVLSTSSGKQLATSKDLDVKKGPLCETVHPSYHPAGVWVSTQRTVRLLTYDGIKGSIAVKKLGHTSGVKTPTPSAMAYDGNHSMFLSIVNAPVGCSAMLNDTNTTVPFGQFSTLSHECVAADGVDSQECKTIVTLPGRSKAEGKRRDLELELPQYLEKKDFFGMMNGYLICASPKHELLVLVDFWPVW